MDKSRMKEQKFASLAAFKARAKSLGYTVRENPDARADIRPFYVAEKGRTPMGGYCDKYAKQSWMLV